MFTNVSDPVGSGFVQSLSHPGGNATGFINIESSVGSKWLQLLKDVMPQLTRATVLFNPAAAPHANYYRRTIEAAANVFGNHDEYGLRHDMTATEKEVLATAQEPSAGLIIGPDAFTFSHRYQIIELVNKRKVPAVYPLMPYRHRWRAAFVWRVWID